MGDGGWGEARGAQQHGWAPVPRCQLSRKAACACASAQPLGSPVVRRCRSGRADRGRGQQLAPVAAWGEGRWRRQARCGAVCCGPRAGGAAQRARTARAPLWRQLPGRRCGPAEARCRWLSPNALLAPWERRWALPRASRLTASRTTWLRPLRRSQWVSKLSAHAPGVDRDRQRAQGRGSHAGVHAWPCRCSWRALRLASSSTGHLGIPCNCQGLAKTAPDQRDQKPTLVALPRAARCPARRQRPTRGVRIP